MAEAEERQFNSLAERIAALRAQQQLDSASPSAPRSQLGTAPPINKRPPPPPPPPQASRTQTAPPLPARPPAPPPRSISSSASSPAAAASLPPPLPCRAPTAPTSTTRISSPQSSPALPLRRPSTQSMPSTGDPSRNGRRNSASSEASTISALSSVGVHTFLSPATSLDSVGSGGAPAAPARKLPPTLDQANLPALPPTRREREKQERETVEKDHAAVRATQVSVKPAVEPPPPPPARPNLPPRLPCRPTRLPSAATAATKPAETPKPPPRPSTPPQPQPQSQPAAAPARRLPPPPAAYAKSPSTNGQTPPPPLPTLARDYSEPPPPPVPLACRPTNNEIEASSARLALQHACLPCRDFSAADAIAAQHPRHTLSATGAIAFLAHALCSPFPSATDKARAIFTWFHHNIDYDCDGFFNDRVRSSPPDETIVRGVAVCAGYAHTYKAIADAAGLECLVVSGHGKGIGFRALRPGDPVPPRKPDGHAWNAVRIDGGEWKLLDACWGAGNVSSQTRSYTRAFKPNNFVAPNHVFGLSHFPADPAHFFRADGRAPAWDEYILGPSLGRTPVTVYASAFREGIDASTLAPLDGDISVSSAGVVRFQFSFQCEHWTPEKNGPGSPVLFLLSINGLDGRKEDRVPMQTDGFWHWLDVRAEDLGCLGQTVSVVALDTFDGRSARGVRRGEFLSGKGRVGMSWSGVAKWNLV